MMEFIICTTCGTQYPGDNITHVCKICSEERQYIPEEGQSWSTHEKLAESHKNEIIKLNDKLFEIVITPKFAIGQRAFLILTGSGNILWDCIALLDSNTINFINSKGGLKAIAISHPHYYSNMNTWAQTFNCPVYIHRKDEQWIFDKGEKITIWEGDEKCLWDEIKIINIGGHFEGSCVILIPSMSKEGTMLCGDTMYLSPSKKHFAIMYSYPNRIPLPISEIKRIKDRLNSIRFDSIFGFYSYQNLTGNAKEILKQSIERYLIL
ncbi:MAG: MBL fold metallo-hydrolase [Ferruginibacter sp.]